MLDIAFICFRYFPWGGLERDFFNIVTSCHSRGITTQVYVSEWHGETIKEVPVTKLPVSGITNHTRQKKFSYQVGQILANKTSKVVVGFIPMPGLDVCYIADICLAQRLSGWRKLLTLLPRYRFYLKREKSVFANHNNCDILLLSQQQKEYFQKHYGTEEQRLHLLPPYLPKNCPNTDQLAGIRQSKRQQLGLQDHQIALLAVGSAFRTKGLDRSIRALASLPSELKKNCLLIVIGDGKQQFFLRLGKRYGVEKNIYFLGAQEDVLDHMVAADLLLHPARRENTGTVLMEAMSVGLPIITSDVCGYAPYVNSAKAGKVLKGYFHQPTYNQLLLDTLMAEQLKSWGQAGREFAHSSFPNAQNWHDNVVDLLLKCTTKNKSLST